MPADASGVTTDDQGVPPHEDGDSVVTEGTGAGRPAGDDHRPQRKSPEGAGDGTGHRGADPAGGNGAPAATEPAEPQHWSLPAERGAEPGASEAGASGDDAGASMAGGPSDDAVASAAGPGGQPGVASATGSADPGASPTAWPMPAAPAAEPPAGVADTEPAAPDTAEVDASGEATARFDDPRPELAPAGLVPSPLPPGAEPPPAPVLVPTGERRGRLGRQRGRHVSRRRVRASRRGLRVNQRLWSIDPWSVFKVSALFYLCLGLTVVVAGTLLYNAGRSVGTVEQLESFVTRMGAYGECVAQAEVPEGTEFRDDDKCGDGEVLVGGFMLDDGTLFRSGAIAVGVLVVAGAVGNVLLVVLLNLLNELTGGLRHTIVKEPVARASASGRVRPRDPEAPPASGSPRVSREG